MVFIVISISFLSILFIISSNITANRTKSTYLLTKKNKKTDVLMLGSSHAAALSGLKKQKGKEKILAGDISILSVSGGDVRNLQIYMDLFFSSGNSTKKVLYFLDPFALNTTAFEEWHSLFNGYPLNFDFLSLLIEKKVGILNIKNYLFSNIHYSKIVSLLKNPSPPIKVNLSEREETKRIDTTIYKKDRRIRFLYPEGLRLDNKVIKLQTKKLTTTIEMVQQNNVEIIFILPPTLLGEQIAYKKTIKFLEKVKKSHSINYYDFSYIMQDEKFFTDFDHLNKNGVKYFAENYLRKIVEE